MLKIKANAKINFSLCVCGKRQDGYHLIDTVMHSIGLYDEIEISKAEEIVVNCDKSQIAMQENIAYKAAKAFFSDYGINDGAQININKNIPLAAGLGGGSADAAAVLLGLNRLYNTQITEEQLCKTALKLGADVPFFINGGCQRAEGIGEKLTVLKPLQTGYILLAKADKKPSTAEMYRILDGKDIAGCDTQGVINAIEQNDLNNLSKRMYNAFETVWGESDLKQLLLSNSPLAVSLSGSGPTWFALFKDYKDAQSAKESLEKLKIDCWITTPQNKAIVFE